MAVPDYFECLREQDLEELIDEEQVFVYDFRIQNMDPVNIEKAEYQLQKLYEKKQLNQLNQSLLLQGEPYYQVYKNFDYWLKFNNQNSNEERQTKLLLSLPLIPRKYHDQITLLSKHYRKNMMSAKAMKFGDLVQNVTLDD